MNDSGNQHTSSVESTPLDSHDGNGLKNYHLRELRIALDRSDPQHILPPPLPSSKIALDIGCGAGQTLIAAYPGQRVFGIDVDLDALKLGRTLSDRIPFICAKAEELPFPTGYFDVVIARVSLPYTNINRSLHEVRRVLKPHGSLWMTLQPLGVPWRLTKIASVKRWIFFLYILVNSLLFHLFGGLFRFPGRGYESFQTRSGIRRALRKTGFSNVEISKGQHFIVTART
jgi:SAM-dependent methyltransferase